MNTLHESSKRTAARWARISQLPRKRRRHWKRQHCLPWKNLTDVPANPIIRLAASTSIYENLS